MKAEIIHGQSAVVTFVFNNFVMARFVGMCKLNLLKFGGIWRNLAATVLVFWQLLFCRWYVGCFTL